MTLVKLSGNYKWIRQFWKSKLFVSIHILKAMLQVKKIFKKKTLYYNQTKKGVKIYYTTKLHRV